MQKGNNKFICRAAGVNDVPLLVKLHQAAFPDFFLTSLGPWFLRLLYHGFLYSDSGICIVAANGNTLIGLVAGTTEPGSFFKLLLRKRGSAFALAAIPGLIRNPFFVMRKCFGALFYKGEIPRTMQSAALLSSIAVIPEVSGSGVGRRLVELFCHEVKKRGLFSVYLTTDALENDSVNRFYKRCGFDLFDSFKRPGNRRMNRWVKTLE
jgi:colanic acid biosynthesis glycosyl transferase WcaI